MTLSFAQFVVFARFSLSSWLARLLCLANSSILSQSYNSNFLRVSKIPQARIIRGDFLIQNNFYCKRKFFYCFKQFTKILAINEWINVCMHDVNAKWNTHFQTFSKRVIFINCIHLITLEKHHSNKIWLGHNDLKSNPKKLHRLSRLVVNQNTFFSLTISRFTIILLNCPIQCLIMLLLLFVSPPSEACLRAIVCCL